MMGGSKRHVLLLISLMVAFIQASSVFADEALKVQAVVPSSASTPSGSSAAPSSSSNTSQAVSAPVSPFESSTSTAKPDELRQTRTGATSSQHKGITPQERKRQVEEEVRQTLSQPPASATTDVIDALTDVAKQVGLPVALATAGVVGVTVLGSALGLGGAATGTAAAAMGAATAASAAGTAGVTGASTAGAAGSAAGAGGSAVSGSSTQGNVLRVLRNVTRLFRR